MSCAEELTDRLRRLVTDRLEEEGIADEGAPLLAILERYLMRPASLLRPRLLLTTAHAYGAQVREEPLARLAAATELLHLFALMHDDAVDGDKRPGVELPAPPKRRPALVLAGDLLQSIASSLIEATVSEHGLSRRILTYVRSVSLKTIVGQSTDISFLSNKHDSGKAVPDRQALFRLYDLKTGYYSFVAPLAIGALAAAHDSTSSEELAALEQIGLALGRAYQLRDDRRDTLALLKSGRRDEARPWERNLLEVLLAEARAASSEPSDAISLLRDDTIDKLQQQQVEHALRKAAELSPATENGASLVRELVAIARL
jgi:geranylgeranyl pyrophosphate synthase